MTVVADRAAALKPSIAAAVLLLARILSAPVRRALTSEQIAETTGASRSQAYEMLPRLVDLCDGLHRPAGRPAAAPERDTNFTVVCCRVRDYVIEHPGTVSGHGARRSYSDAFRAFVLDLAAPGQPAADLTLEQLAEASGVPLGTLKDWRRLPGTAEPTAPSPDAPPEAPPNAPTASRPVELSQLAGHPQIATLLDAWMRWQGRFGAFCSHVWRDLRLPWRRTFIARLLEASGLRQPQRRKTPRPTWNRDTFRRLFPGAQWLGDGTTLAIRLRGRWHAFNLQATLDVDSNALVGLEVADVENQDAVLQAFRHGEATTGEPAIALTLDNKPCNHTNTLAQAVDPTVIVPATPGRGQAKASLEGTFGLFAQTAPPLQVDGADERELARSILHLVVLVWSWTRNGKPRKRLGGRSPADYYHAAEPTEEERAAARAHADDLRRRNERARETRRRRADPLRRQLLQEALRRNDIHDPGDHLAADLARYATSAILFAIALFETKRNQGTLSDIQHPERYLAGIIHNRNQAEETEQTATRLLELRLRHRDLRLAPLEANIQWVRDTTPPGQQPRRLLDLALDAERLIDFRFYAAAAARALEDLGPQLAHALYPHLARAVAARFQLPRERRDHLVSTLARAACDAAA
jgi:hypothetical protein